MYLVFAIFFLSWIIVASVCVFIYRLARKDKSRYDKADHIIHWILLPIWFPVAFIAVLLRRIFRINQMDEFLKAARKTLFPCLVLFSLAGLASPGTDTLRLKKDTVYILPCTWQCSCDPTTVYGGWLIQVEGKYFYKQGMRKNYSGHWTQYDIPVKENRCRCKKSKDRYL
jgi:hypothetical protein